MREKPNIIFIVPDQLRADFLSCYGACFVDTPNTDSLAGSGVPFTNCYSAHPLCVPAWVSLLTGIDAIKNGVLDNGQFLRSDHVAMGIRAWPQILNANGYYMPPFGLSIHVPLLVSIPWLDESRVCEDLVSLGDITATMRHFAQCEIPGGTTLGEWMIYDGEWRLCNKPGHS